ncbi:MULTISPECIES: hypothetical protein [unclassified Variovorax]
MSSAITIRSAMRAPNNVARQLLLRTRNFGAIELLRPYFAVCC